MKTTKTVFRRLALFYGGVWLLVLAFFWLFCRTDSSISTIIKVLFSYGLQWTLLPVSAGVICWQLGKRHLPAKHPWLVPLFFALAQLANHLLTFPLLELLEGRTVEQALAVLAPDLVPITLVISAVCLAVGTRPGKLLSGRWSTLRGYAVIWLAALAAFWAIFIPIGNAYVVIYYPIAWMLVLPGAAVIAAFLLGRRRLAHPVIFLAPVGFGLMQFLYNGLTIALWYLIFYLQKGSTFAEALAYAGKQLVPGPITRLVSALLTGESLSAVWSALPGYFIPGTFTSTLLLTYLALLLGWKTAAHAARRGSGGAMQAT